MVIADNVGLEGNPIDNREPVAQLDSKSPCIGPALLSKKEKQRWPDGIQICIVNLVEKISVVQIVKGRGEQ